MARVSSVGQAVGSLQSRVPVQIHEAPVVSSCDDVLGLAPIHSVDVVTAGGRRKDALHPPAKLDRVGSPRLIPELGGSALDLLPGGIMEQVLVGPAVALDVLAIDGPVQVSNEGLVGSARCDLLIRVAAHLVNVDVVVMRAHCQLVFLRGVLKHLDPFARVFGLEDHLVEIFG